MARYIDAEPMLREAIEEKKFVFAREDAIRNEIIVKTVYKDLAEFIDNQPTADVEEVKHGHWERGWDNGDIYAYCTSCKRRMNYHCYGYAHCPLCGAKMDGRRDT